MTRDVHLEASWKARFADYFGRDDMQALRAFLLARKRAGATIYPPGKQMFAAFDYTPFDAVKAVILGQDPYHGPGQAHGLSFSVQPGVAIPPSLANIFAEIERELGIRQPTHGCLIPWAQQGVLLLNAVLSVERGQAAAHRNRGWEGFTDAVIRRLSAERENLVFFLWGGYARKKKPLIDVRKHCILEAPHPSPLSAYRGFIGCGHFKRANQYLVQHGQRPIDWQLPPVAALPTP